MSEVAGMEPSGEHGMCGRMVDWRGGVHGYGHEKHGHRGHTNLGNIWLHELRGLR